MGKRKVFIALNVKLFYSSFQSKKSNHAEDGDDTQLPNKDNLEVEEQNRQGGYAWGTGSNIN